MRTPSRPIPENAEGYLARAKAVHKLAIIGRQFNDRHGCPCCPVTVGEFLHGADVMGA